MPAPQPKSQKNARALALGAVGGIYIRKLARELDRLRAEAEECRKELAALRAEAEECRKELAALRDRMEQLEAELAAERQRRAEAEDKLRALREALDEARGQNARLREDREAICAELRRQLSSLGQLTEQGDSMVLTLASDILFDLGSYKLRPGARESLAKLTVLRMLLFPRCWSPLRRPTRIALGRTTIISGSPSNAPSPSTAISSKRGSADKPKLTPRDALELRLATVQKLAGMSYASSRRSPSEREQLLAELGDTVQGEGGTGTG